MALSTASLFGPPVGRRTVPFVILAGTALALSSFGLWMVQSASAYASLRDEGSALAIFAKQSAWFGLGLIAAIVMLRRDYRSLRRFAVPALLVTIALLVLVLIPGIGLRINGARRWIGLGMFTIQPSEIAKLTLVIFVADLLARRDRYIRDAQLTFIPVSIVTAAIVVLLMGQPHLGAIFITCLSVFAILWAAGSTGPQLGALVGAVGTLSAAALVLAPWRWARLVAYRDPLAAADGTGYQSVQSLVGIANGGLFGQGVGAGRAKLGYLPYAHNDFIYAVIAEEVGFVGALLVVVGFGVLALCGIHVARTAPDRFGSLLAVGISAWLIGQAVINMGAVTNVLPVTGVGLPLMSAGGSSLMITMAAVGILCSIARQCEPIADDKESA